MNFKAHRLIDLVFKDNYDVFRNTNANSINQNDSYCRLSNVRMVTVQTNQENQSQADIKTNGLCTHANITYLEDWILHIRLTKGKNTKNELNQNLIELKKEVRINCILAKTYELAHIN
jgi:hypothetical protein